MENTRRRELPTDLANGLRSARSAQGLGLREAARIIGITPGYLTLLEQGKRFPSLGVALRLAATLDLSREPAAKLLELTAR